MRGGSRMPRPVDRELVQAKFALIKENVEQLQKLAKLTRRMFCADAVRRAAAERLIHVCIEATIDVCSHIISARRLRKPEHYTEMPTILKEAGVVSEDMASSLIDMIRFRNILVHLYARVDAERLHQILQTSLDDFHRFEIEIVHYLQEGE